MHGQGSFQVPSNLNLMRGANSRPASISLLPDSSKGAPDYRYEGAIVGAVVFGAGFYALSQIACESGCDSAGMKGSLLGVVVGGLFGLLIGGMITKD